MKDHPWNLSRQSFFIAIAKVDLVRKRAETSTMGASLTVLSGTFLRIYCQGYRQLQKEIQLKLSGDYWKSYSAYDIALKTTCPQHRLFSNTKSIIAWCSRKLSYGVDGAVFGEAHIYRLWAETASDDAHWFMKIVQHRGIWPHLSKKCKHTCLLLSDTTLRELLRLRI